MKKLVLVISGMKCEHCAKRVSKALMSVEGIENVEMDINNKTATITVDGVNEEAIIEAVSDSGYRVVEIKPL